MCKPSYVPLALCALSLAACTGEAAHGEIAPDAQLQASTQVEHVAACQRLFASGLSLPDAGPTPRFQADLVPFFATHCNFGACHLGSGSSSQLQLGAACDFDFETSECGVDADASTPALVHEIYENLLAPSLTAPTLKRVDPGRVDTSFVLFKLSGCQDAFESLTGCTSCGRPMPGGTVLRDSDPALFDMVAEWIRAGAPFD